MKQAGGRVAGSGGGMLCGQRQQYAAKRLVLMTVWWAVWGTGGKMLQMKEMD